jgi:hypothetical protein
MSKDNLLINIVSVNDFLLGDEKCSVEQRNEVIDTLVDINQKKGRQWIFSHDSKGYIIDEYNEYNDFVKTYTFKNES